MDLASSSSEAPVTLFPGMQQVRSLPNPPLSCTELQVSPPPALLFISHPSVKVNSLKEGMRGKKPIGGER